jgi:hypothetical protein
MRWELAAMREGAEEEGEGCCDGIHALIDARGLA